jgi:dUTP pyrophosphatase
MDKLRFKEAAWKASRICDDLVRNAAPVDKEHPLEAHMANEVVAMIAAQAREDFTDALFKELFSCERKFEAIRSGAIIPYRGSKHSACYDFISPVNVTVPAGGFATVETGIRAKFPSDEALVIYPRSNMGFKHDIVLVNGTGIIDADYYGNPTNNGEILIGLRNHGSEDYFIRAGEKVAQGMFVQYGLTDNDNADAERIGGIGSTGK